MNSRALACCAIFLRLGPAELLVGQRPLGDVQQRLLGEVADQARVCAVLEHRGRPGLLPRCDHAPQVHVAPVERPLRRVFVVGAGVRIPELHRRVDVQHAVVVAPLDDLAAVDVPGQIDQEIAGREMLAEKRAQVVRGDALLDEAHALRDPRRERGLVGLELHDRDLRRLDVDVLDENGQGASRDETKTHEQNTIRKRLHADSAVPSIS